MTLLEQEFIVRNIQDSPKIYLGLDLTRRGDSLQISTKTYVTEILKRYRETYGELKLENVPLRPDEHPELDKSSLLCESGIKHYQHIIGIMYGLLLREDLILHLLFHPLADSHVHNGKDICYWQDGCLVIYGSTRRKDIL
ncbi:MAG: hypothetical protein ACREOZ_03430 [Gloeomargaritales cyanobacterium]